MADLGVCYLWAKIKIMDFGNFQTILILLASFFIFRDSLTRKNLDIIVAVENCVQFQQINLGKSHEILLYLSTAKVQSQLNIIYKNNI